MLAKEAAALLQNMRWMSKMNGQTIDLFSNDNVHFQGLLTNKITEFASEKITRKRSRNTYNYIFQTTKIDSSLSSSVAKQILGSGQLSVPTDSLIPSWEKWYFYCQTITFQCKLEGKYIAQSFRCPWNQTEATEFAGIVASNHDLLKTKLELEDRYKEFMSLLTGGSEYSRDGYGTWYRKTNEQIEEWVKDQPRRDYLKSMQDTIYHFIESEIAKQQIDLTDVHCFETYHLTFSRNGRLKEIKLFDNAKPQLDDGIGYFFEDKQEIRKCRNLIRQIFREIDLSSFDLKYPIQRTFSVWNDEILIGDNTIY